MYETNASGIQKRLDTMPRETETQTSAPPADWRAEAERRGEEAFEAAPTEPEPAPEPALAWLWTPKRKEPPNVA